MIKIYFRSFNNFARNFIISWAWVNIFTVLFFSFANPTNGIIIFKKQEMIIISARARRIGQQLILPLGISNSAGILIILLFVWIVLTRSWDSFAKCLYFLFAHDSLGKLVLNSRKGSIICARARSNDIVLVCSLAIAELVLRSGG